MMKIKGLPITFALTLICALLTIAQAQTPRLSTVNITPDSDKVHISATGDVSEMRIEISDEQGDVVFQSGAITGGTLDWKMTDAQGERVAAGTYLVTVTFHNPAGKLRKRVEQVTVAEEEKANTQAAVTPVPNAVQATITGAGTAGRIAKFTGASTIGNSVIFESSSKIGIGTSAPTSLLTVINSDANNPTITEKNNATNGVAIFGYAPSGFGVVGQSSSRRGVTGVSSTSEGVFGTSSEGDGVSGESSRGNGVFGFSDSRIGVYGQSNNNRGVYGFSSVSTAVEGISNGSVGVHGKSNSTHSGAIGVFGESTTGNGVAGKSISGTAVSGTSDGIGVKGTSSFKDGVVGQSFDDDHSGVVGSNHGSGIGVYGESLGGGYAGYFAGNVRVTGTINPTSDRAAKADFRLVNGREILRHLAWLPIQTWSYKSDRLGARHLGPTSQEFALAFGLGRDDKSIATVDADGVALAAIQGLYQMMQEKEKENQEKDVKIGQLSQQVERLQARLAQVEYTIKKRRK